MCNELGVETGVDLERAARRRARGRDDRRPSAARQGDARRPLASYRGEGRRKQATAGVAAMEDFGRYRGHGPASRWSPAMPLERDTLRRFVQAIMDTDPVYYRRGLRRRRPSSADWWRRRCIRCTPFACRPTDPTRSTSCAAIPMPTARAATTASYFGLDRRSRSPFKRLLNGGNEIEFFRCLASRRTLRRQRALRRRAPQGRQERRACCWSRSKPRFPRSRASALLVNRQTLIWR